jgi:hypothetical protein
MLFPVSVVILKSIRKINASDHYFKKAVFRICKYFLRVRIPRILGSELRIREAH